VRALSFNARPERRSFIALVKSQFDGVTFSCSAGAATGCLSTGRQAIAMLGADEAVNISECFYVLAGLLAFFYCLTYAVLRATKPRYATTV